MNSTLHNLLLLPLLVLLACNTPKKLTNKGLNLQKTGNQEDAIRLFSTALDKKPDYLPAYEALKSSSQQKMGELSSDFFLHFNKSEYPEAINTFHEMERLANFSKKYNVDLNISETQREDYLEAKAIYLENLFNDANNALAREEFDQAATSINKIKELNSDFKKDEIEEMKTIAVYEPYYRLGQQHLKTGNYRKAYYDFEHILENIKNYKDSQFLLQKAKENAQFNIAVYQFKELEGATGIGAIIHSKLVDQISNSNNPFVKIIDRNNTHKIINEQRLSLDGVTGDKLKIGEILSGQAIIEGTVIQFERKEGDLESKTLRGYEEKKVKKWNAEENRNIIETVYEKVTYKEHQIENKVSITFQFQLISVETGEILLSKTLNEESNSTTNYASYNGNANALLPGHWLHKNKRHEKDKIIHNRNAIQTLQNKLNAEQKPASLNELSNKLTDLISSEVANIVLNYNPNH